MKKLITFLMTKKITITLLTLLLSMGAWAEKIEPNICLTDFQEKLPNNSINKVKEMRLKAANHCLECGTTACKLTKWDASNKTNQTICNRLFCKPTKTNKTLFASNENHGFGITQVKFSYSINSSGRIEDVVLKEVRGEMDRKRALVYLKDNLKLLRYEPIVIEGESYSLTGLQGLTGWNIIEKGM
ncbi:MAG: hypothetical protein ACJ0F3_00965 [Gammaproteobacteria bacterium]